MRWEIVRPRPPVASDVRGSPEGFWGPGRRWGHTCNAVRGGRLVYVFGGYGCDNAQTNDVHVFDTAKQTWSKPVMKGSPPSPRDSHSCTTVRNKLFVFGGTDGKTPLKDLHILDTSSNSWIQPILHGNGPDAREGHSAALVDKRLFIFGGCGKSVDLPEEVYYNDLYILHTETLTWERAVTSGSPPSPRDSHTCSSWRNKIIILGGEDSSDCYLSDVHVLNADTLSWRNINTTGEMLAPRAGHTTAAVGSNLYVFGGFTDDRNLYDDLHVLNLNTGIWSRMTKVNQGPCARFSVASDCLDEQKGILVFMGGCNKNLEALNDMYYLHTDTKDNISKPDEVFFEGRVTNINHLGYEIEAVINGKVLHGMIFSCTTDHNKRKRGRPNQCDDLRQDQQRLKTVKTVHQGTKKSDQRHLYDVYEKESTPRKLGVDASPSKVTKPAPNDGHHQTNMESRILKLSSGIVGGMKNNEDLNGQRKPNLEIQSEKPADTSRDAKNDEAADCPSKLNPENSCHNPTAVTDGGVKNDDHADSTRIPEHPCQNPTAGTNGDVMNDDNPGGSELNPKNQCQNPTAVPDGDAKKGDNADSKPEPDSSFEDPPSKFDQPIPTSPVQVEATEDRK